MFDLLVVGAGFAGSVVASQMARNFGKRVLLIDRRGHVGGNAFDYTDDAGILVHKYGPHIFHTNSREVFDYLSHFTEWRPYEHRVRAQVGEKLVSVPINLDTVNSLYNLSLSEEDFKTWLENEREQKTEIVNSEDVVVSKVGRDLYEKLFRGYTRKQWGLDPSELDAGVAGRLPVRTNSDDRYFTDTYQAMPLKGYTRMFENMLDHKNIRIELNVSYQDVIRSGRFGGVVFTGPIDEYFDYCYGPLPYRSLQFRHETLDIPLRQPVAVINYPNDHAYTRVTEFKHLTGQSSARTSIVYEFPGSEGDPYYPIPQEKNACLYKKYAELAATQPHVHFVGRLATYRYYNMDQVVAQALTLCSRLSGIRRAELVSGKVPAASATNALPSEKMFVQ